MEELIKKLKKKEQIVRKTIVSFIEKIIKYFGIDIEHDRYKQIAYLREGTNIETEKQIKGYLDGYMYLIMNHKNTIDVSIIRKAYYIMFNEEIEENIARRIVTEYTLMDNKNIILKSVKLQKRVYEELKNKEEIKRMVYSLSMLNYSLLRNGLPTIKLTYKEIKSYYDIKEDEQKLYKFFIKILEYENRYQNRSYYRNLKELTKEELIKILKSNKEVIKEKYRVSKLYLYGSFSKEEERIDSDIDLLVVMEEDISYEEKKQAIDRLKKDMQKKLKRFTDVEEIIGNMNDEQIRETQRMIKVI